ncbi:glutamate--tRNA ligase [Hydrogenovibrio marinus]|uniref:Glutamate--tRNA ligase n=1 Tax=Hydrogenovibrio marinus TaxID=28885 RepID=A0A066ZNU0_HYDMR|nr:glutamate--tRNA ligase [Hydrogenovibrio marinus]KDN95157.1 glutamyl-tRNA synthetase [Hydrogenovibrio marinus]BBN59631.1 glutamate--tRNA ligase [Hydrogenovibrio marinus]
MVKTRFAPSPTGYLHIGGVRTALYSWLYAKQKGGDFILRIEDTDLERSTQESVDVIMEGMEWLGLSHSEGPYYQTQRFDRYKVVIQQLLDNDLAYYCYATPEELDAMREQQRERGEKPRYDGRYRDFKGTPPEGVKPVIRFKNPLDGDVVIDDIVKGKVTVSNKELDDLIIARSDGTPTYNLTVVVDDWDMNVTHVIRGDDHLNNTPRQINLYHALGASLPRFAHIPMVLGPDGSRLSKRHGAVSVLQYKEEGFLPEALLNYLVRLGWSYKDQEVFTIDEMVEYFDLEKVNSAPSTFNVEKLLWINQQHIQNTGIDNLVKNLTPFMEAKGLNIAQGPDISKVADLLRERAKTLVEMANGAVYFYQDYETFDDDAAKKHLRGVAEEPLRNVQEKFAALSDWSKEAIHHAIETTATELDVGMGKVGMPLRVAITGGGQSPSIDATAELIGQQRCVDRISLAIEYIQQRMKDA